MFSSCLRVTFRTCVQPVHLRREIAPLFSSNGDGQTADERELDLGLSELGADLTKSGLE